MTTNHLKAISIESEIPENLLLTPIERLFAYHNLSKPYDIYTKAELLIVTCVDSRIQINIPKNFAYIARTPAARIKELEFAISFVISFAGIQHVALIGHTDCKMVNLSSRKEEVVQGLIHNVFWNKEDAEKHFNLEVNKFEISNEIDFVISQTNLLKTKYQGINFVPMIYNIEDDKLYLIEA